MTMRAIDAEMTSGRKWEVARGLEVAVRRGLMPTALLVAAALTAYTVVTDSPRGPMIGATATGFLVVLTALELTVGRWRPRLREVPRDALFFAFGGVLDGAGGIVAAQLALWLGAEGFGPAASLPLAIAAPLGFVVADGAAYAIHRVSHEHPLLWRMHALHHYPRELYALMSTVNAPLLVFFFRTLPVLALVACGFAPDVIFAYAMFDTALGLSSHTGVDTRNPWLSRFFNTPEVHRLHHSADPTQIGNHSLLLTLWDHVGGTYVPPGSSVPTLGLSEPATMPRTWLKLLLLRRP
ncbi:sterol desaturase family protein [Nannocystis sp. ILAH1]|uniref:sterol desaturase family protein n=1 Tax=unclassified Nannocystis TaxID=2627009 RepID=UPI00226EB83A|nr:MULTISPECIES: sterol desaturase family protein [unclassified Nannocystis]MCY0989897.1 sterol desaturase family protein [Nannocystis sp. ILAH1]MCY1071067.1 sterol desaturase family protein [Nannocystis sp. RBIL2]